jgi:transposase-like protein
MGVSGVGPRGNIYTPPTSETNSTQAPEQLLSQALQGDQKAIEQLAQKLGIDPEQLKQLIQQLTGKGGKPEGAGGGGKPEGAGGGGKPEGAGGAEGKQGIEQLLQTLMQAVKELKEGKTGGKNGQTGHSTEDSYEAASGEGPVNLNGGQPTGNPMPPPVEPPSI